VRIASDIRRISPALTAEYLEFNGVLPIDDQGDTAVVGTWRSVVDAAVIDDLSILFDKPIEIACVDETEAVNTIQRLYGASPQSAHDVLTGMTDLDNWSGTSASAVSDLRVMANEAPVVQLMNLLLLEALEQRASDVHLESHAGGLTVRYRIDGALRDAESPPAHLAAALLSRLKIMASLDIAERRVPQDGRIRLRLQDREVDVRMSTIPTLHGESVALRMLDSRRERITLDQLGMPPDLLREFRELVSRPQGMILVTGPTGSGKTTTLYAALAEVRNGSEKVVTIEDPVEYQLDGVTQMPVNRKHGVTFASALKGVLRHDPDVILVGEIRDAETAQIATQAALTGHLVLSTLHTNDSVGALDRLADLGVERYLIAATLHGVIAQRLVRCLCRCRRATQAGHARTAVIQPRETACGECGDTGSTWRSRSASAEQPEPDPASGFSSHSWSGASAF
jgi:general secretion pathway protein E